MEANLVRKIEALESEVRRWKIGTVLAMALLVAGAASPFEQARAFPEDRFVQQVPASKLIAHDFTLAGDDGKPYGRLFTKENQPLLEFYDSKGEVVWSAPPARGGFRPVDGR